MEGTGSNLAGCILFKVLFSRSAVGERFWVKSRIRTSCFQSFGAVDDTCVHNNTFKVLKKRALTLSRTDVPGTIKIFAEYFSQIPTEPQAKRLLFGEIHEDPKRSPRSITFIIVSVFEDARKPQQRKFSLYLVWM